MGGVQLCVIMKDASARLFLAALAIGQAAFLVMGWPPLDSPAGAGMVVGLFGVAAACLRPTRRRVLLASILPVVLFSCILYAAMLPPALPGTGG